MTEDVLDLDGCVERDLRERLVHGAHHAQSMARPIEEVGVAERDVPCAGRDLLGDVGDDGRDVDDPDAAVVHDGHRAVTAAVDAPAARLDVPGESLLAVDPEPAVAIERRERISPRHHPSAGCAADMHDFG